MSLTFIQSAAVIVGHSTLAKLTVSLGLRTYQYLEPNESKRKQFESSRYVQDFCKAQMNDSEYSATLIAILLFLHSSKGSSEPDAFATLAVLGSVGYIWSRTFLGYPCLPTVTFALLRYGGLIHMILELWNMAFP